MSLIHIWIRQVKNYIFCFLELNFLDCKDMTIGLSNNTPVIVSVLESTIPMIAS